MHVKHWISLFLLTLACPVIISSFPWCIYLSGLLLGLGCVLGVYFKELFFVLFAVELVKEDCIFPLRWQGPAHELNLRVGDVATGGGPALTSSCQKSYLAVESGIMCWS